MRASRGESDSAGDYGGDYGGDCKIIDDNVLLASVHSKELISNFRLSSPSPILYNTTSNVYYDIYIYIYIYIPL